MLKVGSLWIHKTGNVYVVLLITNTKSTRHDEYPPMVSYRRINDMTEWSRPISKWYQSMTEYAEIS